VALDTHRIGSIRLYDLDSGWPGSRFDDLEVEGPVAPERFATPQDADHHVRGASERTAPVAIYREQGEYALGRVVDPGGLTNDLFRRGFRTNDPIAAIVDLKIWTADSYGELSGTRRVIDRVVSSAPGRAVFGHRWSGVAIPIAGVALSIGSTAWAITAALKDEH
jgi:hypothetical protein